MRISTQQIFANGLKGITNASSEVTRTQEQISSGRRVNNPSDDPVASTRILALETELNVSAQYQRNIDNVEGRLQLSETYISSMEQAIQRIRELVIQTGDGALSNDDRGYIALEIEQRLNELVSIANSKDAEGNYLFAGFSTDTTPFVASGDNFSYQGDEGLRYEQIGSGLQIAANLTGKELFTDIPVVNNEVLVTAASSNSSTVGIASGLVVDRTTYDALHPANYHITFNALGTVIPAGPNYSITDATTGQVLAANVAYAPGDVIAINGIEIGLDGIPDPGDTFIARGTNNQDALTTIQRIASSVAGFTDSAERSDFIGDSLNNLDNILASLSQGRSKIGARLNTLETARGTQQSLDLINNELVSELRDLDYAEAVSRLSFQTFVLEAAQSSFVRISNLSLFNFLR